MRFIGAAFWGVCGCAVILAGHNFLSLLIGVVMLVIAVLWLTAGR